MAENKMRRNRHAKIIATLGPSSSSEAVIEDLFKAGADVFRFNFSHGSHEEHRQRYELVRKVEAKTGRPIAVLADLQGPKLRIGLLECGPLHIAEGERIRFELDGTPGSRERVPLPHPEIFAALKPGVELLVDDGKLRLVVDQFGADWAEAVVSVGGVLSQRKGVSVVGAMLPVSALTEKDKVDLAFALEMGADWVALSFVQRPEDLDEVRKVAAKPIALMAKLEKPSAIERLDEIIAGADAVMVARGDLGVEMPPERVPSIQRQVLRLARSVGKPVVVATQMLESMIEAPMPTRAEASDVATAIYDGADAVMLSAESAAGRYPVQAVSMMDRIITEVEKDPHYRTATDSIHPVNSTIADVICNALRHAAVTLPLAAVVTYTTSGASGLAAARERPPAPILSLCPGVAVARRLALVWGLHSVPTSYAANVSEMVRCACSYAQREGFAIPGDIIAIAAGMPFGVSGTTNLLRIERIPSDTQTHPLTK